MGLLDLFGSAEPTNDKIVQFQKEMAIDAERRAEDLKLRRQGAYDQINAIYGGGTYDPSQYANYDWDAIDENADLWKLANRNFQRDYLLSNYFGNLPGLKPLTAEDAARYQAAQNAVDPKDYRPRAATDGEVQTYSGIGDTFYDAYRNSILDYYQPQLDRSYRNASGQTMLNFAGRGTRRSSAAGEAQGDLRRNYDLQTANVYMGADNQTGQLRDSIMREKQAALDLAASAEDPTRAVDRALAEVNAVQPAPRLSPLGDIFQAGVTAYQGYQDRKNRDAYLAGYNQPTGSNFGGAGRTYG